MSKTNDLMALADAWAMSAYADGKKNDGTLASHKSCVCVVVLRAAIEQALADEYDRGFKAAIHAVEAQPHPEAQDEYPSVKQKRLLGEARAVLAAKGTK